MAGGCPAFGSGCGSRIPASRRMVTKATPTPKKVWTADEIRQVKAFRDELYKYWETSMM